MLGTDVLLALWAISLFIVGAYTYFRGARKQLEECVRFRHSGCWMSDQEWSEAADIGGYRTFDHVNK